jgi:hypothetical protein
MKIFFKNNKTSRQNFFFLNPFICQSGKITNSISQGQNIEFVITMLKSNVEKIHKRKTLNQLLNQMYKVKDL